MYDRSKAAGGGTGPPTHHECNLFSADNICRRDNTTDKLHAKAVKQQNCNHLCIGLVYTKSSAVAERPRDCDSVVITSTGQYLKRIISLLLFGFRFKFLVLLDFWFMRLTLSMSTNKFCSLLFGDVNKVDACCH